MADGAVGAFRMLLYLQALDLHRIMPILPEEFSDMGCTMTSLVQLAMGIMDMEPWAFKPDSMCRFVSPKVMSAVLAAGLMRARTLAVHASQSACLGPRRKSKLGVVWEGYASSGVFGYFAGHVKKSAGCA